LDYSTILYDVDDGILTITLNRPEALNAFTNDMLMELIDACDRADADDNISAIIVTGAGRGFCAGADLSRGASTFDSGAREDREDRVNRDGGGRLTLRLYELNKPIIAAINGAAVGVGVTMTLAMDIRLASTAAKFGFVFARRGIVPEACSSYFLPRAVGISKALEWCYSGRVFPGSRSHGRWFTSQFARTRRSATRRSRHRGRHPRQCRASIRCTDPPHDVENARCRSSDGSTQD
jgi:enoyl-CoA hydratase/carnithine racemase